jgi:hypothetical protein
LEINETTFSFEVVARRAGGFMESSFVRTQREQLAQHLVARKSGVALRFPPQSMTPHIRGSQGR